MLRPLLLLCCVLPLTAKAQTSLPTSAPTSLPTSAPTSLPASAPTSLPASSQPSSQPSAPASAPSSEPVEEAAPFIRVLRPIPAASLVLRGLPEPVKNLRVGLHADHVVFRGLPGDTSGDLTSFDTIVLLVSKRLYTGLTLETRVPISHQARNDFNADGALTATQSGAFGNLTLGLNQTLGGNLRKALSLEVSLPTASGSPEAIQTGALAAISSRYELPLFMPGAFALRGRVAAGSVFNRIGAVAELGLDALWASGDASELPTAFQLDVRGGFSVSYRASDIFSAFGEVTFATSLTDGEDTDDLAGDINSATSLHVGGRVFLGRVSLGGFLTVPQDEPLGQLSNIGLGIDVFSALF